MTPEGCVFVVIVTLIIVSMAATYIAIYLSLLFQYNFIVFCLISPIFMVVLILLFISYFRAVCTQPGHPDQNTNKNYSLTQMATFMQNSERHKKLKQQRRKKRTYDNQHQIQQLTETSYCDKCSTVKLPRVHHCKICQRCIIRMDHHCPWVGNCIGRYNNKFFILFLLYATVGLGIMWISILVDALMSWKYVSLAGDDVQIYLMGTVGIFALLLFLSIGVLLISQINGLNQNVTTLESFIPTIQAHVQFATTQPIFKKDQWEQNFQEVFGKSYWLVPTAPDLFEIPFRQTQLTDKVGQIQFNEQIVSPELNYNIQRQRTQLDTRNF